MIATLALSFLALAPHAPALPRATPSAAPAGRVAAATELKIATLVPEGSVWDKSLRDLERAAKAQGASSLAFRIYPGGVAGDEADVLRKIRLGQLHGGVLSIAGLGEIDPAVQVFQVPLYFSGDEEARFVLQALDARLRARLEEKGYVLVHWGHAGWLDFFSTAPVRTVADLKRQKHFVWAGDSGLSRWYEEAGMKAVPLAATDVLTGLKTGMFDCLPSTPLAALSLQWFRSAGHMLDYPVSPLYGGFVLAKRAWDKLSAAEQAALRRAGLEQEGFQMREVPRLEREAVAAMRERGLVVTEPDPPRGSAPWVELSEHFAQRMLASYAPPELVRELEAQRARFRAAREPGSSGAAERAGGGDR